MCNLTGTKRLKWLLDQQILPKLGLKHSSNAHGLSVYRCAIGFLSSILVLSMGCSIPAWARNPSDPSVHLMLGNPSQARKDLNQANNYLIQRPQYALSYNNNRRTANWASWQLNTRWLGSTKRQTEFMPDTLPAGWYRVSPRDYAQTSYERGHLVPSGDRRRTAQDDRATFLMTNIIPQAPQNNDGAWKYLEEYCRFLVEDQGKELYIIAGVDGEKYRFGSNEKHPSYGSNIAIPKQLWKVVVVLERPGLGVGGVNKTTRVIAVKLPNDNQLDGKSLKSLSWKTFLTTVDQIEASTGYDLLSNVPADIQAVIEAKVDSSAMIPPPAVTTRELVVPRWDTNLTKGIAAGVAVLTLAGAYGLMQAFKRRSNAPQPSKQQPSQHPSAKQQPRSNPSPRKQSIPQQPPRQPSKPSKSAPGPSNAARAFSQLERETLKRKPKDVVLPANAQQDQDDLDLELRILQAQLREDDRSQNPHSQDSP